MNANTDAVVTEALLLRRDDGGVVTLTLNRPEQFNSNTVRTYSNRVHGTPLSPTRPIPS